MAIWVMPMFIKDGQEYSSMAQKTSYKNDGTLPRMPKTGKETIPTYVEADVYFYQSGTLPTVIKQMKHQTLLP